MKRRSVIVLLCFLWAVFPLSGQDKGPIDLVVLLDTSSSMSGSYEELSDYLIGPFLREFLHIGDTFHLISFSSAPRTEISRRIEGLGDVETIIGRMLLMYPLDPYSDISAALAYGERYVSSLPPSRQKRVILISDGDHSPPRGASSSGGVFQDLIASSSSRLSRMGAEFRYLPVPLEGQPAAAPSAARPAQPPASTPAASAPPAAPSAATPAAPPAAVSPAASAPVPATSTPAASAPAAAAPAAAAPALAAPQAASPAASTPAASAPPLSTAVPSDTGGPAEEGAGSGSPETDIVRTDTVQADTGDTVRPRDPGEGQAETTPAPPVQAPSGQDADQGASERPSRERTAGFSLFNLPLPALIALGLLLILILALIIFFMMRRLHDSPNNAMAYASGAVIPSRTEERPADEGLSRNAELLASFAANQRRGSGTPPVDSHKSWQDTYKDLPPQKGPVMLSLFVEDQNTAIGRRNIHTLKNGYTFTVGGGRSDFLIFLVPIPPHIAEIRSDGSQWTFIPRKPQFFPDIGSQTVPNCIGKTIRIISEKNYELKIRFERYEDPLLSLNRLLNSVSLPDK